MWDEIGKGSELPFMQVTDSDHVFEEIHISVKKVVE